jgi:ribosome-binding factor A
MTIKQERMMDHIRELLSSLLLLEVTDPALKGVTITEVVLDRELEYANIYVNALGNDARQAEVLKGLKRANGFLRRELGKRLRLRRVPNLVFHWDVSLARGDAMEIKLNQVRASLRPAASVSDSDPATADTEQHDDNE